MTESAGSKKKTSAKSTPEKPAHHTQPLNIYQRILAVMEEVDYVQKDARVQAGGGRTYAGVSHDAVIAALRRSMIQQGILVHVRQTGEQAISAVTHSGYPKIRYEAWYEVALVNVDEPSDRVVYTIHAHSEDGGDKAPGKAISYAVKTVLLKAFSLETGESDESRFRPDDPTDPTTIEQPAEKGSPPQRGVDLVTEGHVLELQDLMVETGADKSAFLNYYQIPDLGALPLAKYEEAKAMLERKKEAQSRNVEV